MRQSFTRQRQAVSQRIPDIAGLGGAISGFLAGIVMIVLSPLLSLLTGIGIWEPPKLIAATILGPSVVQQPGFVAGPVIVGTVVHLLISVVLGFLFGLIFHRLLHLTTDFGTPLLVGLCYGLVIFFVAYIFVLPVINPLLHDSWLAPFIAQNMVFGICLGGFYTLLRPQHYDIT
jgi:uncharacterized membrane protein YagU involved in acid resistance